MLFKKKKEDIDLKSLRKAYLIKIENDRGYVNPRELDICEAVISNTWETLEYSSEYDKNTKYMYVHARTHTHTHTHTHIFDSKESRKERTENH